jgi:poly(hydroxyalkanoate) granule-associated protein
MDTSCREAYDDALVTNSGGPIMAAKKGKRRVAKSTPAKMDVLDVGHKVWLAGLGALARVQSEGPKLFESLVEEGAVVHERTRDTTQRALEKMMKGVRGKVDARIDLARDRAGETWDNLEKMFQTRVQTAMRQLGVPTGHEIRSLSRKVDELTRSVQGLSRPKRDGRATSERRRTSGATAGEHTSAV